MEATATGYVIATAKVSHARPLPALVSLAGGRPGSRGGEQVGKPGGCGMIAGRGLLVLLDHCGQDFGTMDFHTLGRVNSYLDRIAFRLKDRHYDALADQDLFSDFPSEYQHLTIISVRKSSGVTTKPSVGQP